MRNIVQSSVIGYAIALSIQVALHGLTLVPSGHGLVRYTAYRPAETHWTADDARFRRELRFALYAAQRYEFVALNHVANAIGGDVGNSLRAWSLAKTIRPSDFALPSTYGSSDIESSVNGGTTLSPISDSLLGEIEATADRSRRIDLLLLSYQAGRQTTHGPPLADRLRSELNEVDGAWTIPASLRTLPDSELFKRFDAFRSEQAMLVTGEGVRQETGFFAWLWELATNAVQWTLTVIITTVVVFWGAFWGEKGRRYAATTSKTEAA